MTQRARRPLAGKGDDPDGYMSLGEVVDFVSDYAEYVSAPVLTHTTVVQVAAAADGYRVSTNRGVPAKPRSRVAGGAQRVRRGASSEGTATKAPSAKGRDR